MTSSPLTILVVCRSFPAHRAGGMEWHAHDVVAGFIAAGHTVNVVTTRLPAQPALAPLQPNGELVEVGGGGDGAYTAAFFLKLPAAVRDLARRTRVDLVHAQGFAGIPLSRTAATLPPLVTTVHGTLFSETPLDRRQRSRHSAARKLALAWTYKHRLIVQPFWKRFLTDAAHIVVDSEFTARELQHLGTRAALHTVPPGVDSARHPAMERVAARARASQIIGAPLDAPGAKPTRLLLAAGRLEPIKGFATLLEACSQLDATTFVQDRPPWRLVLAGEGPDRARLESLAGDLHLRECVHFAGRLSGADLAAAMAAADVLLNPDEGQPAFGLVLAEALLQGTPVLAGNVGAHPEVVQQGDGSLLPPADPAAWAAAINALLREPPESAASRESRRARALARFSRDRMIAGIDAVYRRVIGQ